MPQSVMIGLLVLGGVLLLVAITGGQFKIFVAEVDTPVSNTPVRLLSGTLGLIFIITALVLNKTAPAAPTPNPANNQSSSAASTPSSSTSSPPAPASSSASNSPAVSSTPAAESATATPNSNPVTSHSEYAVVFDPPTNIRSAPTTTSPTLCSVTSKTAIRILGSEGNWYQTDVCGDGRVGYIYRNQVKF